MRGLQCFRAICQIVDSSSVLARVTRREVHGTIVESIPYEVVLPMSRDKNKAKQARPVAPHGSAGFLDQLKQLWHRVSRPRSNEASLLDDPAQHIADIKRKTATDSSEAARLKAALKDLLDRHNESRSVLMHLRVLEKALGRYGLNAFDELPPDVLKRALFQLEGVVSDWSQGPLAALRARLTQRLIKHGRTPERRRAGSRASRFQDSDRLDVKDGSVSVFLEAQARWERSLTGQRP